jgi:hypothetical protein
MDKVTWLQWQKDFGFSDADMEYFYGKPGDPVDTSDVDDFFNGGGQLEGMPPRYMEMVEFGDKVTMRLGRDVEAWLLVNLPVTDRTQSIHPNEWIVSQQAFTVLCLKFGGAESMDDFI